MKIFVNIKTDTVSLFSSTTSILRQHIALAIFARALDLTHNRVLNAPINNLHIIPIIDALANAAL